MSSVLRSAATVTATVTTTVTTTTPHIRGTTAATAAAATAIARAPASARMLYEHAAHNNISFTDLSGKTSSLYRSPSRSRPFISYTASSASLESSNS